MIGKQAAVCFFGLMGLLLLGQVAWAKQSERSKTKEVLSRFFANSEKVSFTKYKPTTSDIKKLEQYLKSKLPKKEFIFFQGTTNGKIDGFAYFGQQQGKHGPIGFAVKLTPCGEVIEHEVVYTSEIRGIKISRPDFAGQFVGKSSQDPLVIGLDIDAVTGATVSSKAYTLGLRRALKVFELAYGNCGSKNKQKDSERRAK